MLKHCIINYDKLNPPADWNLTPVMVVSYIEFFGPCCYYIGIDLIICIDNGLRNFTYVLYDSSFVFYLSTREKEERRQMEYQLEERR